MYRSSALITGGSSGIGFAIASMLAAEGWDLTLVARDSDKLNSAAAVLAETGSHVEVLPANMAAREFAALAVATHLEHHACLDMLVNNAGVGFVGPIATKSEKQAELEISLNLKAAYYTLQAAIPELTAAAAAHGKSYVVNVSSFTAQENPPNASMYAATKAALVSLSKVAHAELSQQGVHVTALLPGFVDTPGASWVDESLRGQMLTATDVAEAVRFLVRTSGRCFIPEIVLTTAGDSVWHSLVDWSNSAQ